MIPATSSIVVSNQLIILKLYHHFSYCKEDFSIYLSLYSQSLKENTAVIFSWTQSATRITINTQTSARYSSIVRAWRTEVSVRLVKRVIVFIVIAYVLQSPNGTTDATVC